jgi:hypothetical protein
MLVTFPSPIPELQHPLLPLKMLRARECALTPCFSVVFTLDSHLNPLRSLGVRHHILGENYVHIGKSHDNRNVTIAIKLINEVT